jgi:hypothetical protein
MLLRMGTSEIGWRLTQIAGAPRWESPKLPTTPYGLCSTVSSEKVSLPHRHLTQLEANAGIGWAPARHGAPRLAP